MFNRNLVFINGFVLFIFLPLILMKPQTFEEMQTWHDIIDAEVIEILPEDFEEINPGIRPAPSFTKSVEFGPSLPLRFRTKECPPPPNFPTEYQLNLENYHNWSEDLTVEDVWKVSVRSPKDVVKLANWAYVYGYKLRAKGYGQSWAPVTVTRNSKCSNTILVDTTKHLTQMRMVASKNNAELRAVYAQAGASIESLMDYLASNKAALYSAPVNGESTVGGVLALGGHGVGAARMGTRMPLGFSSGSMSNLILSFKAVVYDHESQSYVLQKFTRSHEDSRAFLTHIGRAFITEVLLMVGPAYNMRCENRFDYTTDKLLASQSGFGDLDNENLASLVEKFRAVELTVYPYSNRMWVMNCWTTQNVLPSSNSRYVDMPYPFSSTDSAPKGLSMLMSRFLSGFYYMSPIISKIEYYLDKLKVKYGENEDIWGPSKNMILRYKETVKRTTSSGYAILTTRNRVQKVASDFYTYYEALLERYSSTWRFPQNEPLQISVTGLDDPADIPGMGKFEPPALSFLSPMKGEEYDTAIFIGINIIPGTRHFESFMRELESYLFLKYDGNGAIARPEWSKAWGFTDFAAWDNHIVLKRVIPTSFGDSWQWAVQRFDYYDPYMVFSNDFLDAFLKANRTVKWKKEMKGGAEEVEPEPVKLVADVEE